MVVILVLSIVILFKFTSDDNLDLFGNLDFRFDKRAMELSFHN